MNSNKTTYAVAIAALCAASVSWGQQQTPQPSAPTQAHIAACLAALPPEPKPPKPHGKSMFTKLDGVLKQGGIDPDALRTRADQAAKDNYDAAEKEYQKQKSTCSAPVIAPAAAEQASASVAPVAPPAEAKPTAPAISKPVMSADGRHLYVCPKNSTNAPDGLPVCKTADGSYVPLQEIAIPAGALPPPPVASQPTAKKTK